MVRQDVYFCKIMQRALTIRVQVFKFTFNVYELYNAFSKGVKSKLHVVSRNPSKLTCSKFQVPLRKEG